MTTATVLLSGKDDQTHAPDGDGPLDVIRRAIEHAGHHLPSQGPITVFIHHNPLHAFEDVPFDEGVERGARLFGCQPYLAEETYRGMLPSGRIRSQDIDAALLDDLGEQADVLLGFMGTRFHLRQAMLHYPLPGAPPAELLWFIAETDALTRFRRDAPEDMRRQYVQETRHWVLRDHRNGTGRKVGGACGEALHRVLVELIDQFGRGSIDGWSESAWERFTLQSLWRVCALGVRGATLPSVTPPAPLRHRDLLLAATGRDTDELVNEVLIRFCSAFLDQGLSHWSLPEHHRGLWASFVAIYQHAGGLPVPWMAGLADELARIEQADCSPLACIQQSLQDLGVEQDDWEPYLIETLLALRGWAGMIRQVEIRGDRVAHSIPAGSLDEYLAIRLVLERLAIAHVAGEELGFPGPLSELKSELKPPPGPGPANADQRAFQVFQLAQLLGWLPHQLAQLSSTGWETLFKEIEDFPPVKRRQVLHAAFERRYRNETLDAISIHAAQPQPPVRPKFQVICCLDEREESFRRHLEEVCPEAETFGAAGFYGIAMYYRGAADAHFVPLCPVVIVPQHWVTETAVQSQSAVHHRMLHTRRRIGSASHQVHLGSRTFLGGAVIALVGVLASIPLVARVLFPRWTAQIRRLAARFVAPPPATELHIERTGKSAGPAPDQIGYSLEEMACIVRRQLEDVGLVGKMSRLVFVIGHGSSSLNNPHESAHDCGACGGGRGGPNGRALAHMANDPRVRELLAADGLMIPSETVFVGGYHNTCDESLTLFDVNAVPASHVAELAEARRLIDLARQRNAHERCRRFESAPLSITPEAALKHVEARAEDLSQVRPEYGHATNAVCIVGRRERTQGLYLDRRSFLVSYDPQQDADHAVLSRILQAAVPVCAGINLEYYFSFVDNAGFGCGTKLPHNITSLLGVMDGAASDLRPGLPWQMVEVHDPVRCLFVIETTPAILNRIMDANPGIGQLCRHGWVQLATLSPDSGLVHLLRGGRFEPYVPETAELPQVCSSIDWYRGWREHLGYAQVRKDGPRHLGNDND
jgi:uncharacterized protein YbcC (UPF0753/DUF2309 family)